MNPRALLTLLAAAATAAGASGCAQQPAAPAAPQAEIEQAQGNLAVSNSKAGQAIFRAENLAPGDARAGEVQLTNSGSLTGDLALVQADIRDRPGLGGGLLSDKVLLAVRDVTFPADPITVFAGPLGVLDDRRLGTIAPGENRRYTFTVRLPDGGPSPGPTTGDNAYLGSGLTVRYVWQATAPDDGTIGPSGAPRLSFRVIRRRLFKRGWLDVRVRCDRPCRVAARGMFPRFKRGGKRRRTRVRGVTIADVSKVKRIRLKVKRPTRRKLKARLAKRRRVAFHVRLAVRPAAGGTVVTKTRKVTIKRKRRRGR